MLLINGEKIETSYFSNTEVRIKEFKELIKDVNYIELKYETEKKDYKINDDLMQLYFVKQEFDSMGIEVNLVLWSMPYQRMDHKNADDLYTLPYVAKFIKDLHFRKILVIEPHSKKTLEFLGDGTVIYYPVAKWINKMLDYEIDNFVLVFPDAGAYERYKNMLPDDVNICVFSKKRNHYTNEIIEHSVIEGKILKDSNCLIVDDICSSGQTLMDVANYAKEAGAYEIVVIVAHCENEALKREILKPNSSVRGMLTSNSMISCKHDKILYNKIDKIDILNLLGYTIEPVKEIPHHLTKYVETKK